MSEKHPYGYYNISGGEIPIKDKVYLSIGEASKLFGIGIDKITKLVNEAEEMELKDVDIDWILKNGSQTKIHRENFEKYLLTKGQI